MNPVLDLQAAARSGDPDDALMHAYSAYGLTIRSALPIPELLPTTTSCPDVRIQFGAIDCPWPRHEGTDNCFHPGAQETCFWWERIAAFQVREGRAITVERVPGGDEQILRLPLLGVVMAVLLHQRGGLVLHGSAVAVAGQAVVFLGGKGYGKSTAAAALYGRGHNFLADDIVALDADATGTFWVRPGFPQFKLWPEAAAALGDDPARLPRLAPQYEKRSRRVRERFAAHALPLRRVYALAEGPTVALRRLAAAEALQVLIAHSYVARFGGHLLRGEQGSAHLAQCAGLFRQVPICALERPQSLPLLEETARLVEAHVTRDAQPIGASAR